MIGVRWAKFLTFVDDIDAKVKAGFVDTYQEHIGRGCVSLSPGYKCVNIRKWFKSAKGDLRPT